jgi:hypothetical protein
MTTATAPAPAVTREVLEDRWNGLINDPKADIGWSPVMVKLDKVIRTLYEDVSRRPWTGYRDPSPESPDLDGSGDVTSAVHDAFKRALLDEIDKRGLAR